MSIPLRCGDLILLAQERTGQRKVHAECLSAAGFAVLELVSTDEAVSALESCSDVRLLIVEPYMPGCVSGLELGRFVSRRWPHVSVLVLGWPTEAIPSLPPSVHLLPDTCPSQLLLQIVLARLALPQPVGGSHGLARKTACRTPSPSRRRR